MKWFGAIPSALAFVVLLTSVPWIGSRGAFDIQHLAQLIVVSLVVIVLARDERHVPLKVMVGALVAVAPTVFILTQSPWRDVNVANILTGLWSADGVLYQSPLLWLGLVGLVGMRRERPTLALVCCVAVVCGIASLSLITETPSVGLQSAAWIPFLLPGMAWSFMRIQDLATRKPAWVITGVGLLMTLWNLLFMEQYRTRLIPSDDTVSFPQVTANSAALLSHNVGTPAAWPANWIFAMRLAGPMDQWDAVASRRLFSDPTAAISIIELGDDATPFAPDLPLLMEGFGQRRTCGQGWCRDLDGAGRILLPIQNAGQKDFIINVRARGSANLTLSMEDAPGSTVALSDELVDATLRVPGRVLRPGLNVLSLRTADGGRATIDRLTLTRDLPIASAR